MSPTSCAASSTTPCTPPTWSGTTVRTHEYIVAKQKVLRASIREREDVPYAATEQAFHYRPLAAWDKGSLGPDEQLTTYRYPAQEYRRPA